MRWFFRKPLAYVQRALTRIFPGRQLALRFAQRALTRILVGRQLALRLAQRALALGKSARWYRCLATIIIKAAASLAANPARFNIFYQ